MTTLNLPNAPTRADPDLILRWIEETQRVLESAFNFGADSIRLKPILKEPAKPRNGDVVYVGVLVNLTDWDPGGDGLGGFYGYHDGSWVKFN